MTSKVFACIFSPPFLTIPSPVLFEQPPFFSDRGPSYALLFLLAFGDERALCWAALLLVLAERKGGRLLFWHNFPTYSIGWRAHSKMKGKGSFLLSKGRSCMEAFHFSFSYFFLQCFHWAAATRGRFMQKCHSAVPTHTHTQKTQL